MYVVLSYYWYLVRNVIRLVSLDKSRIVPTPQEKHVGEASFNLLPLLIQTNCQFVKIIHIGLEGPTSFLPPPDSPTPHSHTRSPSPYRSPVTWRLHQCFTELEVAMKVDVEVVTWWTPPWRGGT